MRGRTAAAIAACAIAAAMLTVGCTRPINRAAERRIRDALSRYVGPARAWRAHVDNPAERTVRGRIGRVSIEGERVGMGQNLVLDTLEIEMRDVDVDVGSSRVRSIGPTSFRAVVREADLNAYLRSAEDGSDAAARVERVELRNGALRISATYAVLGGRVPFRATVAPRLAGPTRLEFDPRRMSVAGVPVPLPAGVLAWLARRLDAGFDFGALPFPLRVTAFTVADGAITVDGNADVMPLLRAHNASAAREGPHEWDPIRMDGVDIPPI
ncbi:MAG: DUF2993 domain-containing protein [Chthonomonadales bacterium]|nr:DUF2993 domain-containing protein [Chthonomonadales bacterium]